VKQAADYQTSPGIEVRQNAKREKRLSAYLLESA